MTGISKQPGATDSPRPIFQARSGADGPACPDEMLMAAFFDGTLTESQHAEIEKHVAGCHSCIQLMAALGSASEEQAVPEPVLAAAKRLVGPATVGRVVPHELRRWSIAAAAAVLFGIVGYNIGLINGANANTSRTDLIHAISLGALEESETENESLDNLFFKEEGARP